VLFCGEGPGVSEDELGKPFAGPAGHLLDKIIEVALEGKITYAMTNLVGCIPRDGEVGKATQPPDEAIRKCTPRLKDLIWIAKPRLIVCVGALASKWLQNPKVFEPSWWEPLGEVRFVSIAHPAFLLRLSMAQRPLEVQRAIITLRDAGEELGAE
jgi:DNA polymerase